MMGITTLLLLFCLLATCPLTRQELVELHVVPEVTAECGKQLTLTCKVSSMEGLVIKHMGWFHDSPLCSMDSEGNIITHSRKTMSHFHCEYENGQLSLVFQEVQPMETEHTRYRCKLHSNKGAKHGATRVEMQECHGSHVEGVMTSDGPSCTFSKVYPGGDVHWFHGSRNLSDGALQNTTKRVEEGGYQTIHSRLEWKGSDLPYNCSLKSTRSSRYIASTLVQSPVGRRVPNGAGSLGVLSTILCISVVLVVSLT